MQALQSVFKFRTEQVFENLRTLISIAMLLCVKENICWSLLRTRIRAIGLVNTEIITCTYFYFSILNILPTVYPISASHYR